METDPLSATLWVFRWDDGQCQKGQSCLLQYCLLKPQSDFLDTVEERVYRVTILHILAFMRMWICVKTENKKVIICGFVLADDCTSSTSVSISVEDNCPVKPYFPQKTYLRFDQANIGVIIGEKEVNMLFLQGSLA